MTLTAAAFDPSAEFDRQVHTLVRQGYPVMAGLAEDMFARLLAPLRAIVTKHADGMRPPSEGRAPFLLVIGRELVPIERAMAATALDGGSRPGVIDRNYQADDIARFMPIKELELPEPRAYVVFDVERGEEFCGAVPDDAMATVAGRGRTPLTIEEGVALITQFPTALAKNKCFSLGGSRCGDRRVPALWISRNAPKLGWCWAGNPHTWLGMASAGARAVADRPTPFA